MSPDPEESESSATTTVVERRRNEVNGAVNVEGKYFVCPKCKQRRKSQHRTPEKTETGIRTSKTGSKMCKKCRKTLSTSKSTATTSVSTTMVEDVERNRRRSSTTTLFHPHWTHYCFLLTIYLVFSVILYIITLQEQQQSLEDQQKN